ncbi:hypothetical protein ACHAXM_001855 [Skeletonema potamos]
MTTTEESVSYTYTCADPLPQLVTYTNSVTNETKTESIPTKISSLKVVFDYNIFHADDISFGATAEEESKGVLGTISDTVGSISDTISGTVSNLFNGGDGDNEEVNENLVALEKCMVDNIWKEMLASDTMTWVEGDESQCAGLIIDETSRRLQDSSTLNEVEQDEPIVVDNSGMDQTQQVIINDAGTNQTQPVANDDSGVNQNATDTTDTLDTADVTTFTGTKLIGLDSLPIDSINTAGCSDGSSSCTSIRGVISASYIGTNENAVAESIARMVQDGMKSGSFLCEGSPAKKLKFEAFVGTNYNGKDGHGTLIVDTNRGTEPEETPNYLTKYGKMFIVFVALLSVGVIIGLIYRRRKKQKKGKQLSAAAEQNFEANLQLEEGAARCASPDLSIQSGKLMKMVDVSDASVTDEHGTSQVELSLSPKSVT